MPIRNKPQAAACNSDAAGEPIGDQTSEAAKVKRNREQAYFNSYDFDAIETSPYDEVEARTTGQKTCGAAQGDTGKDDEIAAECGTKWRQSQLKGTATITTTAKTPTLPRYTKAPLKSCVHSKHSLSSKSNSSCVSSTVFSSGSSSRGIGGSKPLPYTYLQRLGSFFGATAAESIISGSHRNDEHLTPLELVVSQSTNVTEKDAVAAVECNGNFLLPRAMLKYQSVGVPANSMPAVISTATLAGKKTLPNDYQTYQQQQQQHYNNNNKMDITHSKATVKPTQSGQTRLNYANKPTKTSAGTITASTVARHKKTSISSTSTSIGSNSGAAAVTANTVTGHALAVHGGVLLKKKGATPMAESEKQRGRANSHQSHYSTEKSGSSGYYSSNVCSTYSLEDHIYCEPVIDVVRDANVGLRGGKGETPASAATSKPTQLDGAPAGDGSVVMGQPLANVPAQSGSNARGMHAVAAQQLLADKGCSPVVEEGAADRITATAATATAGKTPRHFSEHLRVLETSIENLDRHLKKYPSLSSHEHIASYVQSHHTYLHNLPTIVEGYTPSTTKAPTTLAARPTPGWRRNSGQAVTCGPADAAPADDSLMDIDLDSFLLVDEQRAASKRHAGGKRPDVRGADHSGIDNPTFLSDEQEENHRKCANYINSCPEDAYRVESDIVAETGSASETSLAVVAEHYPKRYEDQLHFQSTRELLEDVRDKIRLLSRSSSSSGGEHSGDEMRKSVTTATGELPKELEGMIRTLKYELECYLARMNQHSELEIRQLCSGLVKHHNIVRMQKAFDRRRTSHASLSRSIDATVVEDGLNGSNLTTYEVIRGDCTLVPFSNGLLSARHHLDSMRSTSDPNFKLKRKSLAEVFPLALTHCYADAVPSQPPTPPPPLPPPERASVAINRTQIQRNLSFHQPILNQLDAQAGGAGAGAIGGADRGAGEFGEKDSILEWHSKKPSIWEMYYGTNRMNQSLLGKRNGLVHAHQQSSQQPATMSYPSSRPESDFTLDLPRAEQLRIKMEKEKKFRQRCRYITTFLSLVFFLLTVMVVSLVLTRGKRMFGSMI